MTWIEGATPGPMVAASEAPSKVKNVVVTSVGYYGNVSAVVIGA